jgi:hypothetical protein
MSCNPAMFTDVFALMTKIAWSSETLVNAYLKKQHHIPDTLLFRTLMRYYNSQTTGHRAAPSPRLGRPRNEANHALPSCVKIYRAIPILPPYGFVNWCLIKQAREHLLCLIINTFMKHNNCNNITSPQISRFYYYYNIFFVYIGTVTYLPA